MLTVPSDINDRANLFRGYKRKLKLALLIDGCRKRVRPGKSKTKAPRYPWPKKTFKLKNGKAQRTNASITQPTKAQTSRIVIEWVQNGTLADAEADPSQSRWRLYVEIRRHVVQRNGNAKVKFSEYTFHPKRKATDCNGSHFIKKNASMTKLRQEARGIPGAIFRALY